MAISCYSIGINTYARAFFKIHKNVIETQTVMLISSGASKGQGEASAAQIVYLVLVFVLFLFNIRILPLFYFLLLQ